MNRVVSLVALAVALNVTVNAAAQERCTRATLQKAVDSYIAAQTKGQASLMSLAKPLTYMEQMSSADIATGILKTPLKIDFHRSLLDTTACETFTEVIVTDKSHPYVIGAHLTVKGGSISAIDLLVADADDWLFNADNYLKYSTSENWAPVPPASRATRAELLAAANAYLDVFNDNSTPVPWGTPCNRLEGGAHTGAGSPTDSCNAGVPSGMLILKRRFIVDEEMNAVDVLDRFIKETGAPDSHLFRLENGKIRYVHTITICLEENCGFPRRAGGRN
jgi:hypothetical protein